MKNNNNYFRLWFGLISIMLSSIYCRAAEIPLSRLGLSDVIQL